MSTITKDQILEGVAALSVMEIVELISAMEEKFGVSAAAVAAGPAAAVEAAEEQTEFDVVSGFIRREQSCSNQSCSRRNWPGLERS